MSITLPRAEAVEETTTRLLYPRPITFDEWLEVCGPKDFYELVDGALVERPMVQLEHEKLNLWLLHILDIYSQRAGLGLVLGTRSPVRIALFRGRMPDLFFVRKEREDIVGQKATTAAPDLVLEIVSPNDRRSDVQATEADYRSIGVGEIVYIDQPRQRVRVLRQRADLPDQYEETNVLAGTPLVLESMGGVRLEWAWLFTEPRPDTIDTVLALLAARAATSGGSGLSGTPGAP